MHVRWIGAVLALSACGFDGAGTFKLQVDAGEDVRASLPGADSGSDALVVTLLDGATTLRSDVIALYTFTEASGTVVRDLSGVAPALDLTIEAGGATRWDATGLTLLGPGGARLTTSGGAHKISSTCKARNAVSVEAWVQPAIAVQGGPARIATISSNIFTRNFTFGMGNHGGGDDDIYILRLGTKNDPNLGVVTPSGSALAALQHVVATAQFPGTVKLFVGGVEQVSAALPSDLSPWSDEFALFLGGEATVNDRRFLGTYSFLAIYCRELSATEVAGYRAAGPPPR